MRESGENYLETIYVIQKRKAGVHALDIALELGFSKPSVTRAMGLLKSADYIEIDELKHIKLTDKGLKRAKEIFERHELITKFWTMHGVSGDVASKDACRMEHDISEETFLAIKEFVANGGVK